MSAFSDPRQRDRPLVEQPPLPADFSAWQQVVANLRDDEKTPLVRFLLHVIEQQAKRIEALEAEIAQLKGGPKKPASNSKPSALSKPAVVASPDGKRPGSAKQSKTQHLTIHEEIPVPPKNLPEGSKLVRRDPYIVQDLIIRPHNIRYLLETWQTPTGELIRGELPAGIQGHFGHGLCSFVLQQHYAAHVPQCRILEELRDFEVNISSGQVNCLITENHDAFHAEKDSLLPMALNVFTALGVDDSGAPHQGKYGSCLCICNEFFTSLHSSDSKERSKFLDVLRCGHTDYVLNDAAGRYLDDQGLPAKIVRLFETDGTFVEQTFANASAWNAHLDRLKIDNPKHRQTLTEAALLGSAIAHGVSPDLGIVSDGSSIYALFVHGLCWIHQERNLAKLTPCGSEQSQALEAAKKLVWELYADLKAYRLAATPAQAETLRQQFDAIVDRTTCWPELNAALQRMADKKADLLRVLDRPEMPLNTNEAERAFRDWATKRKISAGTRSDEGKRCRDTFLSLKSTCRKLGIRFMSYLRDRLAKAGTIPLLSDLVREKAASAARI